MIHQSCKISIIVPVYNVEKYIEECLDSVTMQTYHGTIECILVDDCGIDNSVSIVEHFIENYDGPIQFKLLHHEHNKGLSAARNTGIREAVGEYVFFLDSDDKLYPNSLSDLLAVAKQYQDADIIQGYTPSIDLWREYLGDYSSDQEWIRNGLCTILIPDPAWNKLTKREFILENNLFFAEGYLQEDTIWNYQIQKHITAIAFCYNATYWYRYNPAGIMNGMSAEREARSFARVFMYAYEDLMMSGSIKPYEVKYLIYNAKKVYHYIGIKQGRRMLATQNNVFFNQAVLWSTSLGSIRNVKIRNCLVRVITTLILNPILNMLCHKNVLHYRYTNVNL